MRLRGNKVGRSLDDIFPFDDDDAEDLSMADIKLFQSWYLLHTKPECREIKIVLLFEKLESYGFFNIFRVSEDQAYFLKLSGKSLNGTILFGHFLHTLKISRLYDHRGSNVQTYVNLTCMPPGFAQDDIQTNTNRRHSLKKSQTMPVVSTTLARTPDSAIKKKPESRKPIDPFEFIRHFSRGIRNNKKELIPLVDGTQNQDGFMGGGGDKQIKPNSAKKSFGRLLRDKSSILFGGGSSRKRPYTPEKLHLMEDSKIYCQDTCDNGEDMDDVGIMENHCPDTCVPDAKRDDHKWDFEHSISLRENNEAAGICKVSKVKYLDK
jgi:hypothetical protein